MSWSETFLAIMLFCQQQLGPNFANCKNSRIKCVQTNIASGRLVAGKDNKINAFNEVNFVNSCLDDPNYTLPELPKVAEVKKEETKQEAKKEEPKK